MRTGFRDASLVLAAQGAAPGNAGDNPVIRHARQLGRGGRFAEVREAFLHHPPFLAEVLPELTTRRIFVVPLFLGEGHSTGCGVPRLLGFSDSQLPLRPPACLAHGASTVFYCGLVGDHPTLAEVIFDRARRAFADCPPGGRPTLSQINLFLAAHGNRRDTPWRAGIEQQADRLRQRQVFARVHTVFLEEAPFIADCYQLSSTRYLVIVPVFLNDGPHVRRDIPAALGWNPAGEDSTGKRTRIHPQEINGRKVCYTDSVGRDPRVIDIILQRVTEAAALRPQSTPVSYPPAPA